MKPYILLTASLVAFGALACSKENKGMPSGAQSSAVITGAPKLEMFVMSQCPYGVQVVNAIAPVKKQLGGALDLRIHYIGDGAPGSFSSMHGPAEVMGDIVQLCAAKQAPDKYLDMILCQNENMRAVDTNWKACAEKTGIEVGALEKCATGDEGQQLLGASFAEAKKRQASGSPTMFLNDQPYQGGRKSRDFLKALCAVQPKDKPQACATIPEAPVVKAIFLSDKRCKECDIAQLEPRLKSELGGLTVTHIDYMTPEGKALYAKLTAASPEFKTLPSVLFEAGVEKDVDGYAVIKPYLRPVGEYQELKMGGAFDPTAEICDNAGDDDGDSLADCLDDGCKQAMNCREAKPKTLDLFVMSQCPYGAKALIAMQDVTDHFGKELTLNIHFIGDEQGGQLASMHGQSEVDEDIREICAIEKYGKDFQYMKYLSCRSKDYRNTSWQPCAKDAGMDEAVIQKCFEGEGKALLSKSFAYAKSLNIGGSPTFLANNKREFNAIEPSAIYQQFCQDNADSPKCKEPLKITAPPPGAAAQPAPAGGQCN